jgi:hypothetical protein
MKTLDRTSKPIGAIANQFIKSSDWALAAIIERILIRDSNGGGTLATNRYNVAAVPGFPCQSRRSNLVAQR